MVMVPADIDSTLSHLTGLMSNTSIIKATLQTPCVLSDLGQ